MLYRVCYKTFLNLKGLAWAIKENNNVVRGYYSTLAEFKVAAWDGCDVYALLAIYLRH